MNDGWMDGWMDSYSLTQYVQLPIYAKVSPAIVYLDGVVMRHATLLKEAYRQHHSEFHAQIAKL